MVSIKSLTLLTLSASIAAAVPQYRHARLHHRAVGTGGVDLTPLPTGGHRPHHHHNETMPGPTGGMYHHDDSDGQATDAKAAVVAQSTSCTSSSTYTEYVTSTSVATVTADKRWEYTRTWTWTGDQGQHPHSQGAASAATQTYASADTTASADASESDSDATATSASSTATSTASSGSSTGKKGLAYNTESLLSQFSGASWSYNWASGADGTMPSGIEYVPMLWGSSGVSAWSAAVSTAISNGATHVLSFNEPDFSTQANLGASEAATLHIANVANLSGKVKVGSPAITNSNIAGEGLDWLTSFLAACGGTANNCKLDFVAFHWYNNPGTIDDFKSHVSSVIALAAQNGISKVWLTEFGLNSGTSDEQVTFLNEAIPWLDSESAVERYAYFMVGNGQMTTNNAINAVGNAYLG